MRFRRIMKHGRMELHKLHIGNRCLGTMGHGNAVACGNDGVGGGQIDGTTASRTQNGTLGKIGVDLLLGVEYVGTIAFDVGRTAGNADSQVVLCDNLHGKVVLLDFNIGTSLDSFHETTLDFSTSVVGMVQDAELAMTALPMKIELPVFLAVKVYAPLDEFLNLLRSHAYNLFYGLAVADEVTGNNGVGNVLVEGVELQIRHRGHTTLSKRGVSLVKRCLANQTYLTFLGAGYFQSITHAGYASTDNQEIVLVNHVFYIKVKHWTLFVAKVQNIFVILQAK